LAPPHFQSVCFKKWLTRTNKENILFREISKFVQVEG